MPLHFAMTGVAGYVAPRHLRAIIETGNELVMALDPSDSNGLLKSYFPRARYFKSASGFELSLESRTAQSQEPEIDYLSICSPTHLHCAHIRLALNSGCHAICEKPIAIDPLDLQRLEDSESRSGRRIYTVLQLRTHESLIPLRDEFARSAISHRPRVVATHITGRGPRYHNSWKADEKKSGGIAMNIGVHLFDLLVWLFGKVERSETHLDKYEKMAGALEMERASVSWYLSTDAADLPRSAQVEGRSVFRSLVIDGSEVDFSSGPDDLHTRVYKKILGGQGEGIDEARPSIELVQLIRQSTICNAGRNGHPILLS
jgi:UDP-N-acetyl-2-amino-2-deoxyglucuronate dehydrogenase